MGIEFRLINLLFEAKERYAVAYRSTVTIGRQAVQLGDVKTFIKKFRRNLSEKDIYARDGYDEKLFHYLGATTVDSLDISDYEQATIIHNMNEPLAKKYDKRYTVVLDGGSLEHIVNFPCAVLNCMRMVAVDGHYISMVPSNNLYGHGFYQFSPELYAGILSPANGFTVERIILMPIHNKNKIIEVNPQTYLNKPWGGSTGDGYYLYVQARKTAHVTKLEYPSQQNVPGSTKQITSLAHLPNAVYLLLRKLKLVFFSDRFPRDTFVLKRTSRGN
jgi:hypothetical protein